MISEYTTIQAGLRSAPPCERAWRWPGAATVGTSFLVLFCVLSTIVTVHGDEPSFADPARSAVLGRGFIAPVLDGQLPGATERLMWQPPGYYVLLAGWFRMVGFGLFQGRLLSALGAAMALGLVFLLARRYASVGAAAFAVGVVGLAPWVVRAGTVIRPEAWTLAAFVGSVVAAVAWDEKPSRGRAAVVVGCCAAAVLLHPIGVVATLAVLAYLAVRGRWWVAVGFAFLAIAVVALLWGVYVFGHWGTFVEQMRLQGERKSGFQPLALIYSQDRLRMLAYGAPALAVLALLARRRWQILTTAPMLALVAAAVVATVGGEEQYPAYVVVAAAPLFAAAFDNVRRWRVALAGLVLACVVAVVPAVVFVARGIDSSGTDRQLAVAVANRPVFLGSGGSGVYFDVNPDQVRVTSPVPTEPGLVGTVLRRQGLLVTQPTVTANAEIDSALADSMIIYSKNQIVVCEVPNSSGGH